MDLQDISLRVDLLTGSPFTERLISKDCKRVCSGLKELVPITVLCIDQALKVWSLL